MKKAIVMFSKSSKLLLLTTSVLLIFSSNVDSTAIGQTDLSRTISLQEIKNGIQDSWPKHRTTLSDVELSYTERIETLAGSSYKVVERSTVVSILDSNRLVKRQRNIVGQPLNTSMSISNSKYSALLNKVSNNFVLGGIDMTANKSVFNSGVEYLGRMVSPVSDAVTVGGVLLKDFVENAEFLSVDQQKESDSLLVTTKWLYKPALSTSEEKYPIEIVLSPNEDWAIRSSFADYGTFTTRRQLSLQPHAGSYVPKSIVEEDWMPNGSQAAVRTTEEFGTPKKVESSLEEFYLSFYGLPEPVRNYGQLVIRLMVLLLGVVLSGVAVYRWFIGRKR